MGQTELLTLERDHFNDQLYQCDQQSGLHVQIVTINDLFTSVRAKIKMSYYII